MTAGRETQSRRTLISLAACVGIVAICGILYQLVIGTVCTYLAGNSTLQFSLTIGLFMSSYGLGSFLSSSIRKSLLPVLIASELMIGFLGGISGWLLFYLFGATELFDAGRILIILVLGTLVGLEIPLMLRIVESIRNDLRLTVGQMMGFDYLGSLVGGLAFPLVLIPTFGIIRTSFLAGMLNVIVACLLLRIAPMAPRLRWALAGAGIAALVILGSGAAFSSSLEAYAEDQIYEDPIVYRQTTPYQKLIVTQHRDDIRLYLDGSLQFSSRDEYRYHEALVLPALSRIAEPKRVLVLGGGDGLALRELMRLGEGRIAAIDLVDLDPAMTRLGRTFPPFVAINQDAFARAPVTVHHVDAFTFVRERAHAQHPYDLILVDLPDPHHESLAKLYSVVFYRMLMGALAPDGIAALQLGSPFHANRSYWANIASLREAGAIVRPYHTNVPSFGEWGFALAGHNVPSPAPSAPYRGRFLDHEKEHVLFVFPADLESQHAVVPSTLAQPKIVGYFQDDWKEWN